MTKGHHVENEDIWFSKLSEWVDWFYDVHAPLEEDELESESTAGDEGEEGEEMQGSEGGQEEVEAESEGAAGPENEVGVPQHDTGGDPDIGSESGSGIGAGVSVEGGNPDEVGPEGREGVQRRRRREGRSKRDLERRMKRLGTVEYVNGAKPGTSLDQSESHSTANRAIASYLTDSSCYLSRTVIWALSPPKRSSSYTFPPPLLNTQRTH